MKAVAAIAGIAFVSSDVVPVDEVWIVDAKGNRTVAKIAPPLPPTPGESAADVVEERTGKGNP